MKNILIVGGGIAGLSAGIALRNTGFDVELVEINTEFNVYGVGIIQQSNALRALDALGVADEAMRRGSPYGKVKMCAPTGHCFAEIGIPPIGNFPVHNGISRKILHDVLFEKAIAIGVVIKMGLTIDTLINKTNEVNVTFSDGTNSTYDLLVGADGINSKVRSLVFGEYTPKYVNSSNWRYPFKRHPNLETGYMFFGKKTKLGLIPMTADTMYLFLVSSEGEDNPIIPQNEYVQRLKQYVGEFPAQMVQDILEQITDSQQVVYSPLKTLLLPEPWFKNRVVMLGDSVHATTPQLGSGAALAIEDAVVLAEELQKDSTVAENLQKYMARRYERCKQVVEVSNTLAEWERMEWNGIPLPEGANMGALMGKTMMALAEPI
jgi:2-polyprenyl-6-methoxyphenol hydroxylase-like FAD-dependent oxidoreductase